jgi:hypothetical protein
MPFLDIIEKSKLDKQWVPLAYVLKNDKLTDLLVCAYIDFDNEQKEPTELIADDDYTFKPYFYKNIQDNQSIRLLAFGPQGSGKSYLVGEVIEDLFENFESKDIFIFARNEFDEPLDRERVCLNDFNQVLDEEKTKKNRNKGNYEPIFKYVNKKGKKYKPIRMNVYDKKVQSCETELYKNSYLIFDDVERLKTQDATNYCHNLRCSALDVGRKLNIDCINIIHNIKGGQKYSTLRDESNFYVFFPLVNQAKARLFLQNYLSVDKYTTEKAMNMRGRALVLRNEFPLSIVRQKEVLLL